MDKPPREISVPMFVTDGKMKVSATFGTLPAPVEYHYILASPELLALIEAGGQPFTLNDDRSIERWKQRVCTAALAYANTTKEDGE